MECLPPSSFLFPLSKLIQMSTGDVVSVITHLDTIYRKPSMDTSAAVSTITTPGFRINGTPSRLREIAREEETFIDSGYASAEDEAVDVEDELIEETDSDVLSRIRNDSFEKDFTIRWLTGFIARSPSWSCPLSSPLLDDKEVGEREDVIDKAASLLTIFSGTGEEEAEVALTRRFEFEVRRDGVDCGAGGFDEELSKSESIIVELNDEPLSSKDHSSVGLQSWASSIVLAKLMCANPSRFGLEVRQASGGQQTQRILELGAGTGLLSIAIAKLFGKSTGGEGVEDGVSIVATDYHVDVLRNLKRNVETNTTRVGCIGERPAGNADPVLVAAYDWQYPSTDSPFDEPFDVIHAADVIYNEVHATWIKACVERLLRRPSQDQPKGGCLFLIMPVGRIGRHEGMDRTVLEAFPLYNGGGTAAPFASPSLKTVKLEEIERCDGVGRADESMYKLFEIRWV